MANASFTKSIGGSSGSGPINAQSIGISQSPGGPVGAYQTGKTPTGVNVTPVANDGGNAVTGMTAKSPPARKDGKAMLKPSKTARS
jgi:hypothetical protein